MKDRRKGRVTGRNGQHMLGISRTAPPVNAPAAESGCLRLPSRPAKLEHLLLCLRRMFPNERHGASDLVFLISRGQSASRMAVRFGATCQVTKVL